MYPSPRPSVAYLQHGKFQGKWLLASCSIPSVEDHPLSAVRDCLFNIFGIILHIWRPFPPCATWERDMPWWHGSFEHWRHWQTTRDLVRNLFHSVLSILGLVTTVCEKIHFMDPRINFVCYFLVMQLRYYEITGIIVVTAV
jgi:hypothetical protein